MRDKESLDTEKPSAARVADGPVDNPVRDSGEARKGRSKLPIVILSTVVVLALGWTAAWYVLAGALEARAERWLERERSLGRTHECGEREVGGFPFRLEMSCRNLVTVSGSGEDVVTLKAVSARAVAQVYRPNHVIAELEGPVEIVSPKLRAPLIATFTLAQASYRGKVESMIRADVAVNDVRVRLADGSIGEWNTRRAELHARRTPGSPAGARDFDVALSAEKLGGPKIDDPVTFSVQSTFFAMPPRWRGSTQTLREWQARGGRVGITALRVESGDVLVNANGTLALNEQGRVNGEFSTDVVRLDALAGRFAGGGGIMTTMLGLGGALLGDPVELEGRDAVRLTTRIEDGEAKLGPIPLGTVPPIFE